MSLDNLGIKIVVLNSSRIVYQEQDMQSSHTLSALRKYSRTISSTRAVSNNSAFTSIETGPERKHRISKIHTLKLLYYLYINYIKTELQCNVINDRQMKGLVQFLVKFASISVRWFD